MKTTQLLIGLNVLIYIVMLKVAGAARVSGFDNGTLLEFGANYGPLVRDGEWWRLTASMFMHVSAIHIAMNMIALYQVGVVLEPHYGRLRFVLIYLASGIGGSLASLAWNWRVPVVSAGASGAISGMIAAGAVAGHLLIGLSKTAKPYRDAMVRWLVMIVGFGLFVHVDSAAHIGGMAVGAGLSWLLDRNGKALVRANHEAKDGGVGLEALLLVVVVTGSFYFASQHRETSMFPEQLINHGVELARQGKDEEAIAAYRRALRMLPNNEVGHFDLALALCRQEKLAECAVEARESTRLDPSRKESWHMLAQALDALGKKDEAKAAWAEYQARGGATLKLVEPDGGTGD
jgi:rhomboid protease GluP